MTLSPREWDVLTGQVGRSDDLAKALVAAIDKTSKTVDVVRYENDRRIVVGTAEVEVVDGDVHATFVINSGSISKRFGTIGPFSIGEAKPPKSVLPVDKIGGIPLDDFDRAVHVGNGQFVIPEDTDCNSLDCTYNEPHKHGFACTSGCSCNRHGRVD